MSGPFTKISRRHGTEYFYAAPVLKRTGKVLRLVLGHNSTTNNKVKKLQFYRVHGCKSPNFVSRHILRVQTLYNNLDKNNFCSAP